jgi:ribosomal protein S18 acetylase RimI-like enzyme
LTVAYSIDVFNGSAPAKREDLAGLHASLLPESPVALLGNRFMKDFYYLVLPREGLITGAVAYVEDCPVGFVVATHDSSGFMRAALRRWWPSLVGVVALSLVSAPKSIHAVWQAIRVMAKRSHNDASQSDGEILSLGVLSEYRTPNFIKRSGLRIGKDLIDCAVDQLEAKGVKAIRAIVASDNTPTKLFYSGLGWTLRRTNVPEWTTQTAEFVWRT